MKGIEAKYEELKRFIQKKGEDGVVIAFSGGVDSSTLAAVCHNVLGEKAVAVTAKSPTYTAEELEEAKSIAKEIGIKHYVVETDELSNEDFCRNPENRCYYCKKELLECLADIACKLGFKAIFEGTNFSDLSDHRPGLRAAKERDNVFSPWAANRFTKDEIRSLAKDLGLALHDKPAMACLASRIPYNEPITAEKLARIAQAEQAIRRITGVRQLRVRDHNGLARIEAAKNERQLFLSVEVFEQVSEALKKLGFKYVTIDLEGYRTGSMLLTVKE